MVRLDRDAAARRRPAGRRRFLRGTVASASLLGFAGCLGDLQPGGAASAADPPAPVDLSGGKTDDMGGMIIGEHFGPNGQIFYRDNAPRGHDNPAWFHTLVTGLFPYYFAKQRSGWTATAVYATDYSAVEYALETNGDRTYISTHTAADTFSDATQLTYVFGSSVLGGMGPALIPFSDAADADGFVADHGGATVTFDEIDREFISMYGSGHDGGHGHGSGHGDDGGDQHAL